MTPTRATRPPRSHRPRGPRRLAALVAVALLATLAPALTPAGADEEPVAPAPATPVLSARRLPGVVQGAVADPALAAVLDDFLDDAAGTTCTVVLDGGRVVYQRDPDAVLVPASLQKLLTATAALEVLGPDRRLVTVTGAASPMEGGVVEGDLFVVGGGDPLLTTPGYQASLDNPDQFVEPLAGLVDALVAAGLREVTGDIVGDDTRHEQVRWVPTWPTRYQGEGFVGPLSALMVNDGMTGFAASPGEPNPRRRAGDPPVLFAQTLKTMLVERGVRVGGEGTAGAAPDRMVEVARLESPPMGEIVAEMVSDSDNTTAELLTREMGLEASGQPTTAAGTAVIAETLTALGLPTDGLVLNDGSGLDPANKVPCRLVLALLERSGPGTVLGDALAVAGETGTLHERMSDSDATGRVRAKTGTLNLVNALAGFAETPSGNRITFVMIQNGSEPRGMGFADDFADELMAYAAGPPLDALGPRAPVG